jgi:hypothetical protein
MLRHKTFYIDKIEELEYCDSKILYLTGGEYEIPFTVEPSVTEHNLENCEGCKNHHSLLLSEFKEKLNIFPNCCDGHRKLAFLKEFKKDDYATAPLWCANKIMHSYHHFMQHIDSDEWYDEITIYFEYCIESYGSTPPERGSPFELGNYFSCLEHLINGNRYSLKSDKIGKKLLGQRIAKIINYLDSYYEKNNQVDKNINILLSKYNEWYNLFPFDLEYFEPLREQFRLSLPIFKKRKKFNKYLGSTRLEVHTVESLTNILLNTTNDIISKINGLSLFNKGKLNNPEKIQLDLILQNRKLELIEIGSIDNSSRKGYIKVLKTWFRTEKKFIKEIAPLLKNSSTSNRKLRPNRTDIAYYIHYMSETKVLKLDSPFPSDRAWKEIGERFGKNSKNIQKAYNLINSDSSERLKKSKINNITYVIEEMLGDDEDARELAKDELKLSQLNS